MQRATDPQLLGGTDPVLETLRALVDEIEAASYFNQNGGLLELSPAYIEARDLVRGYPEG